MTIDEAKHIFQRLCVTFRYEKKMKDEEMEVWLDHLRTVPYELADRAVWEITRSPKFRFMPRVGEFIAYVDEIHNQGAPNAIGVVGRSASVDRYGIWRQDQLVAMTDEEYWRYLTEPEYRDECERRWRHEWAAIGG